MDKVFLGLVLFLPFSNFLLAGKLDIWHTHGVFAQAGILLLFCLKHFKRNKPLALFLLWSGGITLWLWISVIAKSKHYPIVIFMPYFNLLCMVILYEIIIKYIKNEHYQRLLKYLPYSVGLILVYCVLQKLNLDQFYKDLLSSPRDELVGTLGNTMHLAHYLAICLPLFFFNKWMVLFCLGIIFLTGSASGIFIALCVIGFYSFYKRIFSIRETILLGILGSLACFMQYGDIKNIIGNFTFSNGRISLWRELYPIFQEKAITGWGFGTLNALASKQEFTGWRHVHNEFYQYAIETGLIGLGIIIWGIVDYWKRFKNSKKDNSSWIMAAMFLGFTISSLFGYPTHLWLLATMGLVAYSYQYLEVESENA